MTLLPEVREELIATAMRRTVAAKRGRAVPVRRPLARVRLGGVLALAGAVLAVAVAVVAVVSLHHRAPAGHRPASRLKAQDGNSQGVAALEARLAVLRRPQTTADRGFEAYLRRYPSPLLSDRLVPELTRLAATVDTPAAGEMSVYVIVRTFSAFPRMIHGRVPASVTAVAVNPRTGLITGGGGGTAKNLNQPAEIDPTMGDVVGISEVGVGPSLGVRAVIVPDGVTRVKWVFTGAAIGITNPHPVVVYPLVRNNVAVAAIKSGEGPLASATWYGPGGRAIRSGRIGSESPATHGQLEAIETINTSRDLPVAPWLLEHFALFRDVPAQNLLRDPQVPIASLGPERNAAGMALNYWQTRHLASNTSPDRSGLWIIPGTRGVCIAGLGPPACWTLNKTTDASYAAGLTHAWPRPNRVAGLVPDGNKTVTLVLSTGKRQAVPVIDNVYTANVTGHVVAIIDRNTAGHIARSPVP